MGASSWNRVGTRDSLCREGIEYAERLKSAGVDRELVVVTDTFRAMDALTKADSTPVMVDFIESKLAAMRRGLVLEPPSQ